ncbi:MAG: PD-(D/E)XK nuclease family protein [Bacteroidales bacterium]|jgi:CRISPR/Cas system-associated exonuclease Cas4 (RecB family)|nr:PD-(D/E)XK nuclease family protein [Bacteroidales bacterium]
MFLKNLTKNILSKSNENLIDICIVVPNNRAIVHLREQFKDELSDANFLPEILSIQDFILKLAILQKPTTILNSVDLLLELYNIYKTSEITQSDFKNFISWASTVLKDFNEIDLYLANADDVFTYISEAQAIKFWAPQYNSLSEYEKDYLKFLESLKDLYHNFNKYLNDKGYSYTGQLYKTVANNIESISKSIHWSKIYFAGFNALSKCEINIFDYLYRNNFAEIIWDVDKYYFNDIRQESGIFLREMYSKWPETFPEIYEDNFFSEKNINIICAGGNIQQAKIVGNILTDNDFNPNETAIVLADEGLLLPVLSSIPEKFDKFNVTMGVPLNGNSIGSLITDLFTLHSKSVISNSGETAFRNEPFRKVVLNPVFEVIFGEYTQEYLNLLNQEYIFASTINKIILKIDKDYFENISKIFLPWNNNSQLALESILIILNKLIDKLIFNSYFNLESEIAYDLSKVIERIILQLEKNEVIKNLENLNLLLKFYFQEVSVTFYGEPLEGLQILGVLETRLLDFKNVIITSMNEGILPKIITFSSFLTGEMVREYQLPTPKAKTAVFAYHFYRLIQRAQNVYLIYDSSDSPLRTSEKSRYIMQIINELPQYNPNIKINSVVYQSSIVSNKQLIPHPVQKTEYVISRINEILTEKGISASVLNEYLICQVRFYFKYILNISDMYDTESIDQRFIGIMTHEILKLLYQDYIGKTITPENIKNIEKNIDNSIKIIETDYKKNKGISFDVGRNFLLRNIVKNYVENAIQSDINTVNNLSSSIKIKSIEERYSCNKEFLINSFGDIIVKFNGIVDRFDICAGRYRVMDYKTGKCKKLPAVDIDKLRDKHDDKLFQLLMYALLIFNNFDEILELDAGIYALKEKVSKSEGAKQAMIPDGIDRENLLSFESYLKEIFDEMLNPDIVFTIAKDEKTCKTCSYKDLCMI